MTKEKALEISLILKAYSEGKIIQRLTHVGWVDCESLISDDLKQASMEIKGEYQEYRIKPEKKLVPFTFEDSGLFLNRIVKGNAPYANDKMKHIMTACSEEFVWFGTISLGETYKTMLQSYVFEDGSPCGKYVEE